MSEWMGLVGEWIGGWVGEWMGLVGEWIGEWMGG